MCGMFDHISVHESIALPGYPDDRGDRQFQTKQVDYPSMDTYRVTADGRLEQRRRSYREKTEEEKQASAEERGFDSWDAYLEAYNEAREKEGMAEEFLDGTIPFAGPRHETIDEEWWVDQQYHGDVEIHCSGLRFEPPVEEFFSYVLRFTHGELEEVTRQER